MGLVDVTSRVERRRARTERAVQAFGAQAGAALNALELAALVSAARLAVVDFRDLRMNADAVRSGG